ncbi:MAG: hypothetical protein AB3N64_02765 [Puniceicoccaceae bacterium]
MNKKTLILTLSLGVAVSSLSFGEWALVNDFNEAADLDSVMDQTNQEGSNARTELVDGKLAAFPGVALENTSNLFAGVDLGVDLRAASEAAEGPITLYFQLIQPTVSDGAGGTRKAILDTVFGLTHFDPEQWTTETYNSYNAMGRINFGNDNLEVRDGGSYVASGEILQADVVYELWLDVDFFFNEVQMYVKGGQWTERTMLLGTDGNEFLGFRKVPGFEVDGTTPQTVDYFLIALSRGNLAAEKGQDPTYFDNIYVDTTGVNATSPVGDGGGFGMWGPWEIIDEAGNVDTGAWMGFVNVAADPWIYSYSLDQWLYVDSNGISSSGSWVYVFNY